MPESSVRLPHPVAVYRVVVSPDVVAVHPENSAGRNKESTPNRRE